MNKKEKGIMGMAIIGALFIGFVIGIFVNTANTATLISSIEIDEFNIDLNETEMTQTLIKYMEEKGMVETPTTNG